MSIDSIEEYEAQKDYERVSGCIYEDALGKFVFHHGRARLVDSVFYCPDDDCDFTMGWDR